jgi:hypothetical protein
MPSLYFQIQTLDEICMVRIDMSVKSAVTTMLLAGKSVLKPKDFDTFENYKKAVNYIKELSGSGHVQFIYELEESSKRPGRTASILFLLTDRGREQLSSSPPL